MNLNYLETMVDIAMVCLDIYQSSNLHSIKKHVDHKLHEEELKAEQMEYSKEEKHQRQTHLLNVLSEIERHFQQLNSDLISQTRESERDSWDQRSQQLQTLTLAATIMLTALINVLIQGVFEHNTSQFMDICYSLSNAASLALLVISIILCTEIISKASSYMYQRSQKFQEASDEARNLAINMMGGIKRNRFAGTSSSSPSNGGSFSGEIESPFHRPNDEFTDKWLKHEQKISEYMSKRDEIHRNLYDVLLGRDCDDGAHSDPKEFAAYWERHWKRKADAALMSFYLGTILMICANVIFMWELWTSQYNSNIGAMLATILLFCSALIGLIIFLHMRDVNNPLYSYIQSWISWIRSDSNNDNSNYQPHNYANEETTYDSEDSEKVSPDESVESVNKPSSLLIRDDSTDNLRSSTMDDLSSSTMNHFDNRNISEDYDMGYSHQSMQSFRGENPLPIVGSRQITRMSSQPNILAFRSSSVPLAPDENTLKIPLFDQNPNERRRYRPSKMGTSLPARATQIDDDENSQQGNGYNNRDYDRDLSKSTRNLSFIQSLDGHWSSKLSSKRHHHQ